MNHINTREKLRDYIKMSLGAPLINIEVTDEQIDLCIDKSIQVYSYYGFDGTVDGTILIKMQENVLQYKLPYNVIAVRELYANPTYSMFVNIPVGFSLQMNPLTMNSVNPVTNIDIQSLSSRMAGMSTLKSLFDQPVNYDFNSNNKLLSFYEVPASDTVMLEISSMYEPEPEDAIYDHFWIKARAVAEVKFLWGNVVGKYSTNLINGSTINYDRLISEGQEGIQETDEELEGLFEPLGAYVI